MFRPVYIVWVLARKGSVSLHHKMTPENIYFMLNLNIDSTTRENIKKMHSENKPMSSHCVSEAQLSSCTLTLSFGMLAKPLNAASRREKQRWAGPLISIP
jgi:hypothetical protein